MIFIVEKTISWIEFHHLCLQWKFKLEAGEFNWNNRAKHCWVMSTNFSFAKLCWQHPAMFCLYIPRKLSHSWFEFSLVKVIGSNPGNILKSYLLYPNFQLLTHFFFMGNICKIWWKMAHCSELILSLIQIVKQKRMDLTL